MTDLHALRTKLDALRRKTVENGCTEAEAASASEKMAEILAKHGLTEADLDRMEMTDHRETVAKARSPVDRVWLTVGDFARCVTYFHTPRRGKRSAVYFGREVDVLVAEYVHDVVARAVAAARSAYRASPEFRRRRLAKTRAAAMRAFEDGLADRICDSLLRGLWRQQGGTVQDMRNAVVRRREALIAVLGVDLVGHAIPGARPGYDRDRWNGQRAGDNLVVNAGVGTATAPVAGLLR
ncbi:DUF2786 domain-containing protein [Inquilinus sp.]|jgi:hypothetical protein|uniref:DUF2786 domain-containing protein n=1 Tax=Inquilinus sp. TaxID=1932117 RepID=UPI0037838D33